MVKNGVYELNLSIKQVWCASYLEKLDEKLYWSPISLSHEEDLA
jgi:hypothetical protein